MPVQSRWPLSPPQVSIPTFLFGPRNGSISDEKKILLDCARPETHNFTVYRFREWSRRLAAGLQAAGLEQGDRVTLVSGNNFWTPVVVLGVLMAGGIYNSGNPAGTARELAYQMKDSQPRFVLAAENCMDVAREATKQANIHPENLFLFEELPAHFDTAATRQETSINGMKQHWGTLITTPEVGRAFQWDDRDIPEIGNRTAVLIYSSGTTGLPKGVELTHTNLIACTMQLKHMKMSDKTVTERRGLCLTPMSHALALIYFVFVATTNRLESYVMPRYNLEDMLMYIERFKITELILVPPIVLAIAKSPSVRRGDYDLSSVKRVLSGSAPLGAELTEQFEELWSGKVRIRQAWGMSEFPVIGLCWDECDPDHRPSVSVGELVPGAEAKLVREDGTEETRLGYRGEIWIRGPNRMKGYWRRPEETAATITSDGWLRSGDIAHRDENGKWYIVDRIKELIKVRGAQVAPAELEALLLEHPQIVDVAVIGVKTESDDENPRAYVVTRQPRIVTEKEIVDFVASKVMKIKRLTGGVVFMPSIPKNPSGKILRKELRELAKTDGSTMALSQSRL